MRVTPELISRFFGQQCTPEEKVAVGEYFDQHPEELDKYLSEDDWQAFNADADLHPAVTKKMLDVIESSIDESVIKKKAPVKIWLVAASSIIILGIGLIIGISQIKKIKVNVVAKASTARGNTLRQVNDTVYNKNRSPLNITLPDGSTVVLSANSRIYYSKPFTQKLRNIYLQGDAIFKVEKDKTRPFTVYAGAISTTALGTCFKVFSPVAGNKLMVKLYEGKVVIKNQTAGKNYKDVFLTPGRQFVWNDETGVSQVLAFNVTEIPGILNKPANLNSKTIQFHYQQLSSVISQLRSLYHISIKVNEAEVKDKYFTGYVNVAAEPANVVLNTIATLNGFELSEQDGVFILTLKSSGQNDTLKNKQQ